MRVRANVSSVKTRSGPPTCSNGKGTWLPLDPLPKLGRTELWIHQRTFHAAHKFHLQARFRRHERVLFSLSSKSERRPPDNVFLLFGWKSPTLFGTPVEILDFLAPRTRNNTDVFPFGQVEALQVIGVTRGLRGQSPWSHFATAEISQGCVAWQWEEWH